MSSKKTNIFLGVRDVAGFVSRLSTGFQQNGVKVFVGLLFNSRYNYKCDNLDILSSCILSLKKRCDKTKGRFTLFHHVGFFLKWVLFFKSLLLTNTYIFIGTESIFGLRELPVLQFFKKKIVFIFLGSESRPWYLNGEISSSKNPIDPGHCRIRVGRQKRKIAIIEKYADIVICHPPAAQFLTRPFLPFLRIGLPTPDILRSDERVGKNETGSVVIVHAPSNPECKGTDYIRSVISDLKQKNGAVEYKELIGLKNEDVLRALETCDFVIDEMYSDTSLATLGLEAACFGKPAIVGSYSVPCRDYGVVDFLVPPSMFVHPAEFKTAIMKLYESVEERERIGKAAETFVREYWSPKSVANRLLESVCNMAEEELIDPRQIEYFAGWGTSEDKLKIYLKSYLDLNGKNGLMLSDKPDLEKKILEFVKFKEE